LNAEFNKLIKTVGHCARYFEKLCWTNPPLLTILTFFDIFIFSLIKSLSCNKTLKVVCKCCALIGCHYTNSLQKGAKLVDENNKLKSLKLSEFAISFNKRWLKILHYVYFIMF